MFTLYIRVFGPFPQLITDKNDTASLSYVKVFTVQPAAHWWLSKFKMSDTS